MTGEGNFNWRFIFPFKYLPTENVVVIVKKESLFSSEETEYKLPCRLTLEVWDNDVVSSDDFLGNLSLELSKLPRGSKSAKHCTLESFNPDSPCINLFKRRRTKGWWPFRALNEETNCEILAGKVELEFQLLTEEEAKKESVGFGRSDPQALPMPKRPDTSFLWFKNPLKTLKMIIFKQNKWRLLKCALLIFCVYSIFSTIMSLPQNIVKKIMKV
ncbi:otoferlin-like [Photinus pyralis]|uniref:otoferlin-like n=1 Tax=Photinus pyralis TaxID=7054 RepID=UPI0012676917|nr:otoferlin-like [Photinus pyralis]